MENKINIHNTYIGDGFYCGNAKKILKYINESIEELKEHLTVSDLKEIMKLYNLISMFNNSFIYVEFEWMYDMSILKVLTYDDAMKAINKNLINVNEIIESEE